jgi:hypothetical protein
MSTGNIAFQALGFFIAGGASAALSAQQQQARTGEIDLTQAIIDGAAGAGAAYLVIRGLSGEATLGAVGIGGTGGMVIGGSHGFSTSFYQQTKSGGVDGKKLLTDTATAASVGGTIGAAIPMASIFL